MPEEYHEQLRAAIRIGRIEAVAAVLVVACPILAIACWKRSVFWGVLFGMLFVVLVLLLCFLNRKKPYNKSAEPWKVYVEEIAAFSDWDDLAQIQAGTYVKQDCYDGKRIRLLVQEETVFQKEEAARRRKVANKKINELFGNKQMIPMWDAMKKLRINLIVCEDENEALKTWVQSTNRTLMRAEVIVNMALVKRENRLLVPSLTTRFDISELRRYQAAVEYIQLLLKSAT